MYIYAPFDEGRMAIIAHVYHIMYTVMKKKMRLLKKLYGCKTQIFAKYNFPKSQRARRRGFLPNQ